MLNWAKPFNIFCFLDNCQYPETTSEFECLLAVGAKVSLELTDDVHAFEKLKSFYQLHKGWMFGFFGYDLKNNYEGLHSENVDRVSFPDIHFFVPGIIIRLNRQSVTIFSDEPAEDIYRSIVNTSPYCSEYDLKVEIKTRISREDYLGKIKKIQNHIQRGDCYELNFCQEFYAEDVQVEALPLFQRLAALSNNPFSAFYKLRDKYCLCASPERYLKKSGKRLFSQPMKGTSGRDFGNKEQDEENRRYLLQSEKEKSENVMIVDLVRNDLSKVCRQSTVKVDELFGVYSFPMVHQMISTISGEMKENLSWVDVVKETFPMGSMTGAPKKRVMELIEAFEETKRGLFSGAIGYINPDEDFDFNVVIRSMMYNEPGRYLSFQTGSAITFYSKPEDEYKECLLKAKAMIKILGGEN